MLLTLKHSQQLEHWIGIAGAQLGLLPKSTLPRLDFPTPVLPSNTNVGISEVSPLPQV